MSDQPQDEPKFQLLMWHDLPLWQCAQCPFDTLDGEEAFMQHWEKMHGPAPAPVIPEPIGSGLLFVADKRGNVVQSPGMIVEPEEFQE
jgi:hypothetical protein